LVVRTTVWPVVAGVLAAVEALLVAPYGPAAAGVEAAVLELVGDAAALEVLLLLELLPQPASTTASTTIGENIRRLSLFMDPPRRIAAFA
jgi:hypothetical protein